MIIELFGPPGVGKSTFAQALTARLRDSDQVVDLRMSSRPAEISSGTKGSGQCAKRTQFSAFDRLSRPISEFVAIARHPFENARDIKMAIGITRMLPPGTVLSTLRERQYIARLSHSWREGAASAHLALFDQGFVQLVNSLALRTSCVDDRHIGQALDYVPSSGLAIRLEAPKQLLETRLRQRLQSLSASEQTLELDLKTSLESVAMIDRLHNLLLKRGRPVMCAQSLSPRSLNESAANIAKQINSNFKAFKRGAA